MVDSIRAKDVDAIEIPIPNEAFRELKRHFILRNKITSFELTDKTFDEFDKTVMASGKYSRYILADRDFKLIGKTTTRFLLIYEKEA